MGLSWLGPGNYGQLVQVCAASRPCYVVIVNEVKAAQEVRRASPETLVHFRITGHDTIPNPSREAGAERVRWLLPVFRDSGAQLLSIANEWTPPGDTPEQVEALRACCEAYRGAMDEANRHGIKIAVGDFSVANPHIERPGVMDALRPMLAQAERDGHYLCINYYARNGDTANDPDALHWVRMTEDYPRLRVVMREYNVLAEDTPRGEAFTALLRAGDAMWARYPQFMGAALYTLVGYPDSEWKRFEFPSELERYSNWLSQSK
jgi:hypothetical protein